jgi:ribosomal protein S27AE
MAVFICRNKDCPRCDWEDYETTVSYKMVDGALKANKRFCPSCGEEREELVINPERIVNVRNDSQRKWQTSSKGTLY